MPDEKPAISILFSDEFKVRLRTLAKRYRSIRSDLQPLLDDIGSGNFVGDRISGTGYSISHACEVHLEFKSYDLQR